ncbi:MAG: tRNA uridine-5-carboxymethylaminomethyl(34) synthesis GTPase MnmE [Clostridia bacterium]|nr:tRNA uridine-5-carboxymethylaminomethyl(34) synthesis GTPase MnmE [Clostridia bacterium]
MTNHTIAAVSTPFGKGGIAVIRISGEGTADVLGRVFAPAGKTMPTDSPRTAVFGDILDGDTVIDTGVAVFYKGPASFTGEDTAEISCHGGILVTRRVLEAVFAAGATPAEAGEFTRRSFLNGKMTLTEAEAVGLLLDADTDSRMRLASSGARGILSEKLSAIGDRVSAVLSNLFALIDYPEEDIEDVGADRLAAELLGAAADAESLSATFRTGRAVAEGVRTLICGSPNAGKSSLYNALAGEDRAIVTSIPGTTRDILEDTVDCGGVTLRLWDTAGIREGGDEVEMIGIERARARMDEAELILAVYDGSAGFVSGDLSLMDEISHRTAEREVYKIALINKSDAGLALTEDQLRHIGNRHHAVIMISAATGDGIDALREKIAELYGLGEISIGEDAVVWDASRKAELDSAAALLREAASELAAGEPEDAICSTAELALAALRRTDGRGVSEEIVNGIFARFCVGK